MKFDLMSYTEEGVVHRGGKRDRGRQEAGEACNII